MIKDKLNSDILQWDISSWKVALAYWEEKLNDAGAGKLDCLEIGGRQGGLSLWLGLKGHHVICSDLTDAEISAYPLHEEYGLRNISYRDIDVLNIPFENKFDIVIFKSVLGGVARAGGVASQKKAVDEIFKALKPGGMLFFAENLSATRLHRFSRNAFTKWGKNWRYITLKEMDNFLQPFPKVELFTAGFLGAFGRNESQKKFLSRIDKALSPIIPRSWKYIVYGSAVK